MTGRFIAIGAAVIVLAICLQVAHYFWKYELSGSVEYLSERPSTDRHRYTPADVLVSADLLQGQVITVRGFLDLDRGTFLHQSKTHFA